MTEVHAVGDPGRDRHHVLERAAELDAHDVVRGVHAEAASGEHLGDLGAGVLVVPGHAHRRRYADGHLLREGRPAQVGEHPVTLLREDVLEDLRHQLERSLLDALRRAQDQRVLGDERERLLQHRADCLGGHHDDHQARAVERVLHVGRRAERGWQLDVGEVRGVAAAPVDGRHLLFASRPERHRSALVSDQLRQRRAPRTRAEYRCIRHARESTQISNCLLALGIRR